MDFHLLGPIEVLDGRTTLALRGSKQRALLAALVLHANEVVSRDRLLDALWGPSPPETAVTALHVQVSQLRKLLDPRRALDGDRVLLTRPPGYLLAVAPDRVDVARFERLADAGRQALADGRPERATRDLRKALGLWRGPPLADVAYEGFAQATIARLDELHLAAVEDWIDAELQLGHHAAIVGELRALVSDHPLHERAQAQLVLALYRSGRQAEALEAYRRARGALTDEVGIEPSRTLRQLHTAVLRQDPELDTGA